MTRDELRRLPVGTAMVYRDGTLEHIVYLAENRCRRCGRVKVRLQPTRGPWWLVEPARLAPEVEKAAGGEPAAPGFPSPYAGTE
jgi:hypothetical protein